MRLEEALKTTKFSSQKHKAGLNILYTAWWIKSLVSKELKTAGLTNEQFNVLRILKGKHPEVMCVKEVGCRMIEPSSNVPRITDRLVSKKYVERATSAIDKRETVISLTDKGIEILAVATEKVDALFNSTVLLTEDGLLQLNSILEEIRKKQ